MSLVKKGCTDILHNKNKYVCVCVRAHITFDNITIV